MRGREQEGSACVSAGPWFTGRRRGAVNRGGPPAARPVGGAAKPAALEQPAALDSYAHTITRPALTALVQLVNKGELLAQDRHGGAATGTERMDGEVEEAGW